MNMNMNKNNLNVDCKEFERVVLPPTGTSTKIACVSTRHRTRQNQDKNWTRKDKTRLD